MEMCENNDDLKNIWNYKREKEFFSMFSTYSFIQVNRPLREP